MGIFINLLEKGRILENGDLKTGKEILLKLSQEEIKPLYLPVHVPLTEGFMLFHQNPS